MPTTEQLRKLARLAVRSGVGLMPGQELVVRGDVNDAPFIRLIAEEAFEAGAKAVTPLFFDEQITKAKFRLGSDEAIGYFPAWIPDGQARAVGEGAAILSVASADPSLLKDFPGEKVATASRAQAVAAKPFGELITGGACNWSIVPAASPAWAKAVFPGLPEAEAVEQLWDVIFKTTRSDADDPQKAWEEHCRLVEIRMEQMNRGAFKTLHFRAPGTDLKVGLVDGHIWEGVTMTAKNGAVCSPNIPTEEIFTMPHADRVEGVVRSTKPLSLRGTLVDGIEVEFREGKVVSATAAQGDDAFQRLLDTDEGSRHLGEVALVPHSSPISQSGLTFFNTLYDENASCHIALGQSYSSTMAGYDELSIEERRARGANQSISHVDWMIGSGDLDLDGLDADGVATPLMRNGEWV